MLYQVGMVGCTFPEQIEGISYLNWSLAHLQAEVDKQDNLPDFSKTDAHRSAEAQKAEMQAGSSAGQGSLPGCIF